MRDLNRLSELAREFNAYHENPLLAEDIVRRDSVAPVSEDARIEAKKKLVRQKTTSGYYKDPSKQKRNLLKSAKEKKLLTDTELQQITTAERYAVLDSEIRQGGPSAQAQAVIYFNGDALDVNVTYESDALGNATSTGRSNGWLELIAARNGTNDVSYIRLLAAFGANQASLDRALSIALQGKAMRLIQELLMSGADPNATGCPNHFVSAVREQNKSLYTMFLTAPNPLNAFYINQALVEALGQDPHLVAILIALGADGLSNDGQALCKAVYLKRKQEAAMILTNPLAGTEFSVKTLNLAVHAACDIEDESMKVQFLEMLFCAGANANTKKMKDELLDAVTKEQSNIVRLLIDHGTSPQRNDAEGLLVAMKTGQTDLVQVLLQGSVPEDTTSKALDEAGEIEDPDTFEEIVRALVEKGVSTASLGKCLASAVDKECRSLALFLVEHGATLDYAKARSIRQSLQRSDFGLVGSLLEAPCEPSILCEALPDAMKIQPPSERFGVMVTLLNKGVSGKQLHIALQTVAMSATDTADYSLIEALIGYQASVDYLDHNGNCVCTAAANLDEKALDLLCQGNPSSDTASNAVALLPVSFGLAEAMEYEQQVGMLLTLLEKGAYGVPLAELLIKSVRDDYREKALIALVRHGADPNYEKGQAIEEALKLPRISALQLICNDCKIARNSFVVQLPNALNPQCFSFEKASILVHASQDYNYESLLDQPLLDEVLRNGARKEVIELLLNLGANVNFQQGEALQHVVRTGNVEVCSLLLGAGVQHVNIALAFPATSAIEDRPTRFSLMQALLEAAGPEIGQDQALVQAAQEAIHHDLSHVELLLQNHASANYNDGAAVTESVKTNNLPLLRRFVQCDLNKTTLDRAFNLARKKKKWTEEDRYHTFETLLQIHSDTELVSVALIESVLRDVQATDIPVLLLNHGASLDAEDAHAIREVSSRGSWELLKIFIGMQPSQSSRNRGFHAAIYSFLDDESRKLVYQLLLDTGITLDLISAALLRATIAENVDHSLLALLIEFNASLDFESGEALYGIVEKGNLSTLTVLLTGAVLEKNTLDRSFTAAIKLDGDNRFGIMKALLEKEPGVSQERVSRHLAEIVQQNDHDLLNLMMDYKPDPGFNSGESLVLSAGAGDAKSTELLTRAEVPSHIVNAAFEKLLNTRAIRSKPEGGLKTAEVLLSLGVEQHLVDRALLDGFDDKIDQLTKDLVELLIPYKPNVSGGDGKLFIDMAKISDEELFRRLASQKPNLNIVIPALIRSIENEEELISFLVHLEECAERELIPLNDFVIFKALERFPEGKILTKHLLNNGCPANSKTVADLNPSQVGEQETMTLLIWALSCVEPAISEEVIMEILEDGHGGLKEAHYAEVNFQTNLTRRSATLLASATGRNDVLIRLIEIGSDLSLRDIEQHSALFYASKNGYLDTAEILIDAGATADDGSLHEAAREGHHQLVRVLMEKKHRLDFPSAIHADGTFGRTPLEELCLNTVSGAEQWQKDIHESISLTLPTKMADIPKDGGKTMFHLAFENKKSSVDVTRELLSFPFIWENINHSVYLYSDDQGYVYSPTKYVELILEDVDSETRQQLIKLLHSRKCKDRFFANTVTQPDGAVGLPEEVAAAVHKQQRADHEQREELKRREEVATKQREIDAENHRRDQELARQKHDLLIRQMKEQERIDLQVASDRQALILRHEQERQRKIQEGLAAENRLRAQGVAEEAALKKQLADAEYALEDRRRRGLMSLEQTAQSQRYSAEQSIIKLKASAEEERYRRERSMCDYRVNAASQEAAHRRQAASYQ